MGSRFSDQALRNYAIWAAGVNKFGYDASISGDKLQSYPIRVPQEWLIRNGVRTRFTGAVAVGEPVVSSTGSLVLGIVLGFVASKFMG